MNAPTLIVGLGGTGSKVALKVSKMLTPDQKEKIGFAVFDTDVNELTKISEENPFVKTIQTSTKLSVGEYLDIDTHSRDTWFPVNAILNSKVGDKLDFEINEREYSYEVKNISVAKL